MRFTIPKNPYDERNLFKRSYLTINEGNTYCLVGCNGSGKTTAVDFMIERLKKMNAYEIRGSYLDFRGIFSKEKYGNYAYYSFDKNKSDSNSEEDSIFSRLGVSTSSTGEGIIQRLGTGLPLIRRWILNPKNKNKSLFIFFDDCDAGTSIDVIVEMKSVFDLIRQDCEKNNVVCTIVLTANSYEMCRDCHCIDVYNFQSVAFADYEEYKEFVLKSKDRKKESYKEMD